MPALSQMLITAVVISAAIITIYAIEKKKYTIAWRLWFRRLIAGILLGLFAGWGLLWSTDTCNVQDVVPLVAGILFGPIVSLLSSTVGSVLYLSCTPNVLDRTDTIAIFSLYFASGFACFLRSYIFNGVRVTWWSGLLAGMIVSIGHLLMVLWVYLGDIDVTHHFIDTFSVPMIIISAVSIIVILGVTSRLDEKGRPVHKQPSLIQDFRKWLLACVLIGFAITCIYSVASQTVLYDNHAASQLKLEMNGCRDDARIQSEIDMLNLAAMIAPKITPEYYRNEGSEDRFYNQALQGLLYQYDIAEASIISQDGVIVASTNAASVGFHMDTGGRQSTNFMEQLRASGKAVQQLQALSSDLMTFRRYAGVQMPNGDYFQFGYTKKQDQQKRAILMHDFSDNNFIGDHGGILIVDANNRIVSDYLHEYDGSTLAEAGIIFPPSDVSENEIFMADVHGVYSYCMYCTLDEYVFLGYIPYIEVMASRNVAVYIAIYMEIILFAAIFFIIYFLVMKLVVFNIRTVNESLQKITKGDLDEQVNVFSNAEFAELSRGINVTVDALKQHIAMEASRIDQELEYARAIQVSALPSDFPPWPRIKSFDIYATMHPAKEVGGDFYDFFLIGDKLGFVMADVAGKGIPAALFMMTAKTQIKNSMQLGEDLAETFTNINHTLCEHNDTNMFVTAFAGVLDYDTGELTYINAGHTKTVLRQNGVYAWVPGRSGLPLGAMDDISYRSFALKLKPEDILFMYTDGVTEAVDNDTALYGEERLIALLNQPPVRQEKSVQKLLAQVLADVKKFAGTAEQADDITMMAIKLNQKDLRNRTIFSLLRRS